MSMNLTLHEGEKGPELPLWGTPTHITWMCLSYNPKTKTKRPDGGHEGVRRRYLMWVESHLNGAWKSSEDLDHMRASVRDHTAAVLALKRPRFSYI